VGQAYAAARDAVTVSVVAVRDFNGSICPIRDDTADGALGLGRIELRDRDRQLDADRWLRGRWRRLVAGFRSGNPRRKNQETDQSGT